MSTATVLNHHTVGKVSPLRVQIEGILKNEVKLCETRVLYALAYLQLKESFSVALPR